LRTIAASSAQCDAAVMRRDASTMKVAALVRDDQRAFTLIAAEGRGSIG
jgi:hypothetical protein